MLFSGDGFLKKEKKEQFSKVMFSGVKCFSENLTNGPTHPLFLPYWRNATRCTIPMSLL